MPSEMEFVNYKEFVAGLSETENPTATDKQVVCNPTDGPRSVPASESALTDAATESDLNSENHLRLCTPNGLLKLPGNEIVPKSVRLSDFVGTAYKVTNDTGATMSFSYSYPTMRATISKADASKYAGYLFRTDLRDKLNDCNTIFLVFKNLGLSSVSFKAQITKSQYDWSSATLTKQISLAAGERKIVELSVDSALKTFATATLNLCVKVESNDSSAIDLIINVITDEQMMGFVPNAVRAMYAEHYTLKEANAGKFISYASAALNDATKVDNPDGSYTITCGTNYFVLSYNVNAMINAGKKALVLVSSPSHTEGSNYITRLVLNTLANNWNNPVKNFLAENPEAFATDKGLYAIIDFSKIPGLDTTQNNYYLLIGSDGTHYTAVPIRISVSEYPDIPVVSSYAENALEVEQELVKPVGVGAPKTYISSSLHGGSVSRNASTGLYTFNRASVGSSPSWAIFAFSGINALINANKKLAFICKTPQYTSGCSFINKLRLTTDAGNWQSPVFDFLENDSELFKTKNGYAIEIDFSKIPNLNTTQNTYYIVVGTDSAYNAVVPCLFGLYECNDVPVVSNYDYNLQPVNGGAGSEKYIACWGDSLTAQGGWTSVLGVKSEMKVYNCGVGGETSKTIMARQGGDVMQIISDDVTIPATTTAVVFRQNNIRTYFGNYVAPALQGGGNLNPVIIAGVEGTLSYSGGDYSFTRSVAGDAVTIDRPTAITTKGDRLYNSPYLMIIYMGQNSGWSTNDELIQQHEYMIAHAHAENVLVLGFSSGTASSRADYESAMRAKFGRYFVSLREYLAHPIYDQDGVTIISCYGLADASLTPTSADLDAIAVGSVPPQLLKDAVHYTDACKTVIGNMLYKKCQELGIF